MVYAALKATIVRWCCPIQQVVQMGQTFRLGRRARRFLPKTSVALERVGRVGGACADRPHILVL